HNPEAGYREVRRSHKNDLHLESPVFWAKNADGSWKILGALAREFGQGGFFDAAQGAPELDLFEETQVINKEHAVDVVYLVLERLGQYALRLQMQGFALQIDALHQHFFRAPDLGLEPRQAQA